MSEFTTVAHRVRLSRGDAVMACIWRTVAELEMRSDDFLLKSARVKDPTPRQDLSCSGVYHLLIEQGTAGVTTFSGRYMIGKAGAGNPGTLSFSRAVAERQAPVQDGMPHTWLARLTPLPTLAAAAALQVTALDAQRRDLDARAPVPMDAVAQLTEEITRLDPDHRARASRAAVTLRAAHLSTFVPGVRFTLPGLVDTQRRPHPEPVTLLHHQGKQVIVLSHHGQGMSLDRVHLRRAVVEP